MRKFFRSSVMTVLLFIMSTILLFAGTIGGTQAALQIESNNYYSAFNVSHIGVTLRENGGDVSNRDYGEKAAGENQGWASNNQNGPLEMNALGEDKAFVIGKNYDFAVDVKNTGEIDQIVRIVVYKYWAQANAEGPKGWFHGDKAKKLTDTHYDPDLIFLAYDADGLNPDEYTKDKYNADEWIKDDTSTEERQVYYYKYVLTKESDTEDLFSTLQVKKAAAQTRVENGTAYMYDGLGFVVELEADAIQTHNWQKAMKSAWGVSDTIITELAKTLPNE